MVKKLSVDDGFEWVLLYLTSQDIYFLNVNIIVWNDVYFKIQV